LEQAGKGIGVKTVTNENKNFWNPSKLLLGDSFNAPKLTHLTTITISILPVRRVIFMVER